MYRCNIVPRPNQIQLKNGVFAIPHEGRIEDFITRTIDTRISGAESYRLNVCPEGITISAGTPRGLFTQCNPSGSSSPRAWGKFHACASVMNQLIPTAPL